MRRLLSSAVLILLASCSGTYVTAPGTGQPLTLVWQSEFSAEAALVSPSDMVVDEDGNVYVSTQSVKNIKVFDRKGKFVTEFGGGPGTGEGQFNIASGITLDQQDNIYVVDFGNARIQKFDSSGKFLLQWPTGPTPASIAVDRDGNIYIDIFFNNPHHVQKFDSNGSLTKEWGPPGTDDGQFRAGSNAGPEDVAMDKDGNIYIADRVNHRIQKFDPDGNFLAKFGGEASTEGNGLFDDPIGIAIDKDGNLYVLDSHFLQKLSANGDFIEQWSTSNGGPLDRAAIVGLDKQGFLYVFAHTDVTTQAGETTNVIVLKKFSTP